MVEADRIAESLGEKEQSFIRRSFCSTGTAACAVCWTDGRRKRERDDLRDSNEGNRTLLSLISLVAGRFLYGSIWGISPLESARRWKCVVGKLSSSGSLGASEIILGYSLALSQTK